MSTVPWLAALLAFVSVGQAPPRTSTVVAVARDYVATYQRQFNFLLADQDVRQEVVERGLVTDSRHTRGELFTAFVDDARGWMSVQDVGWVDGSPVERRADWGVKLRSGVSLSGREVAAANARYNIGRITRNFGEPTLVLQLLMASRAQDVTFEWQTVSPSTPGTALATLNLRLRRDAVFVRSIRGRVTTSGQIVVDAHTGCIHRTRLVFDDNEVGATLDTTFEHDDRLDLWVPVALEETYTARRTREIVRVHTTYSNYRRFEGEGRLATH